MPPSEAGPHSPRGPASLCYAQHNFPTRRKLSPVPIHLEDRVVGVKTLVAKQVLAMLLGAIALGASLGGTSASEAEVPIWVSCPTQSPDFEVPQAPGEACGSASLGEHPVGPCVLYTLRLNFA